MWVYLVLGREVSRALHSQADRGTGAAFKSDHHVQPCVARLLMVCPEGDCGLQFTSDREVALHLDSQHKANSKPS